MTYTTREYMDIYGAMVTHDTILPGRQVEFKGRGIYAICVGVAGAHGLTVSEMLHGGMRHKFSHPRHEAIAQAVRVGHSIRSTAAFFDCDRRTVHHAIEAHERRSANA